MHYPEFIILSDRPILRDVTPDFLASSIRGQESRDAREAREKGNVDFPMQPALGTARGQSDVQTLLDEGANCIIMLACVDVCAHRSYRQKQKVLAAHTHPHAANQRHKAANIVEHSPHSFHFGANPIKVRSHCTATHYHVRHSPLNPPRPEPQTER